MNAARAFLLWSARRYGVFAILFGAWIIASSYLKSKGAPAYILPLPTAVASELGKAVREGILPTYVADSIAHLLVASISGLVVGVIFGVLIGLNRWVGRFFYPLLNFFQSLGGIAVAPLIVVWFGRSLTGLIVAVNYTVFFPVTFNTLTGVTTVPPVYVNAVRTLGGNQFQVVRDVILPGAMPNILLGMRLAVAYGWRSLIAVEMLFALDGLGFMVFDAQQFLDTPKILLAMIVLGVLVLLIDELVIKPVESLTIKRWGMVHR